MNRRRYLSILSCGGFSIIAGCSAFGSSKVAVSIDNNDTEEHTVAIKIQRQTGETLFEREVGLAAGESRTFDDALPNPSEAESLMANVTLDETTTNREFQIGGATGTSEFVVNIKQGGDLSTFVSQS